MEESDKTTALKKAYAEIILNTAKEAAARVMVSERKSVRFQQDLCNTKEEALRLLVRLKQMIDAKTIEAEITSTNKQQRIDELEAQLQEAEDIITDLRSELNWVRDKLAKARLHNSQSQNAAKTVEEKVSSENADIQVVGSLNPTCISDTKASPANLHNKCGDEVKQFDGLSISNLEDCDACESILDVVKLNKELELHKNGCTQRICALERNVLQVKPAAHVDDQGTTTKDDNENETEEQGNGRCTVLALRARSIDVIKKPPNPLGIMKSNKARKIRRRRKRRWGKAKACSVRSHACPVVKPCTSLPAVSYSNTSMDNASGESSSKIQLEEEIEKVNAMKACKGLDEHLQRKRKQYIDDIAIIRRCKLNKNMKSLDSIPCLVKATDQLVEAHEESNLDKDKTLTRLDPGLTVTKKNADPISGSTNLTVSVKAPNLSADKDMLVKCENTVGSSNKMGSEMDDVHLDSHDLKVTAVLDEMNESPRKVDGNRVVKYTFQRKRKKGSLSDNDDNISPAKRKVEEKENDEKEANESTLGNESSKGTRRFVQVARQLISLSAKRW